jgi:hypothetical protein
MRFIRSPGVFRAMKDKHVIVRIHCHPRNLAEYEAIRELRPSVNHGVGFVLLYALRNAKRKTERHGSDYRKESS